MRLRYVLGALLLLAAAGCSASPTTSSSSPASSADLAVSKKPLPAGRYPSPIAKMVCAAKAQREISEALGVTAVVDPPTWEDHLYACRYTYSNGSFTLSVKELSSWGQTLSYFHGLGSQLGVSQQIRELGQGAFQAPDGGVVVRKDWKVLDVDVTGLPAEFGNPAYPARDAAVTVADVILGCWDGD